MLRKLRHGYIWNRIFLERLTEPLHLNLLSIFVFLFGTFRLKVLFDLVLRPHNAYAILKAADDAKKLGIKTISLIEFGVSSGTGLMNMTKIAAKVTKRTGVKIKLYGFDTGEGMPKPVDYRDHPDIYQEGDDSMPVQIVKDNLADNASLVLGNVRDTVEAFIDTLPEDEPIGYIVLDFDYYSSSKDALKILDGKPNQYLPITQLYCDDVHFDEHNKFCGELLALQEFNDTHQLRKVDQHPFFDVYRIFRKARWIRHMHQIHIFDHPHKASLDKRHATWAVENPYLNVENKTLSEHQGQK